jgi:hypothetical protein
LDDEGEAARQLIGREAYDLNVQQFCCEGLNFGYFYEKSPIISHESEAAPAYTMGSFTPSTLPGCRAPHFWLNNGASLYDSFGNGYTLMKFDAAIDTTTLQQHAQAARLPLQIIDLKNEANKPSAYKHALVLCRTDQHVVWRGDELPHSLTEFVSFLSGKTAQHA